MLLQFKPTSQTPNSTSAGVGATGIEDRLQDGVPQTIEHLREAGMHVWVLTGDKQETAINIAHSARLITDEHKLICINANSKSRTNYLLTCHLHAILCGQTWPPREAISDVMSDVPDLSDSSDSESTSSQLTDVDQVVDRGDNMVNFTNQRRVRLCSPPSVAPVSADPPAVRRRRRRITRSVSESRMHSDAYRQEEEAEQEASGNGTRTRPVRSRYRRRHHHHRHHRHSRGPNTHPHVHAHNTHWRIHIRQVPPVVSLVKDGLKVQTLAIGDGANDVNMIQVANVGVGIGGQEGMQAVMASDFAITRFAFLERLVIVHGHMCYDKLAHTALYLFYKDAVS
ncbi:unnamed protein product [Echinostoma caproni]|uniref:PhoLip_ATPase_C domain-containing protein n=1 Tax=Echinostoma caproni TaxID=27848 RepID=A0A183B335_9TREM|nr:unnamed protein product [Echinostoma caproni]